MDPFLIAAAALFAFFTIQSFIKYPMEIDQDSDDSSDWLANVELVTPYPPKAPRFRI